MKWTTRPRKRALEIDGTIQFLLKLVQENLSKVISNNRLYSNPDDRPELTNSQFQRGHLPLVSVTPPESVTKASDVVRPRPPQMKVTEIHKTGNVEMRPNS